MNTQTEAVTTINRGGQMIGLIKRDEKTKKSLVYLVKEAKVEDIAELIDGNKDKQ